MKSTVAIVSTLLVTTLGFSSVATANETLMNLDYQNQQETLIANPAGAAAAGAGAAADPVEIIDLIMERVGTDDNRDAFVKSISEEFWQAYGQQYNVMVFNLNHGYSTNFTGQKMYETVEYDGIPYGVWVFEEGEFINKGDGGYINWAFKGNWDRTGEDDKTVIFSAN